MKQIVILFVLILFTTASSDLLKSISKFADDGDNSSKFAKSKVSPFSEEESEDYDNEDTEPSKKMTPNSSQDDDDEEVDVMAQLKSYQQKLSTSKDVKPPQPQKKQVQVISESESEYDDEDDSGNMWSRGISKKLAQTESKPLVLPIQTAKEQIKNDFNQFTSLKMPEVQQRPQETKIQDQTQKVQDDQGKEHSADFEKMKQAQLEKYSKRFHLDEPKESKSMYEDDSLKEFMPKINFQPINIQETKTSQQIQQNPEKKQVNKYDELESESDEEDDILEINNKNSQSNKNNNKNSNDLQSTSDAFDFFNQNKQQQKSNKKSQKIEQSESEDEDSETEQEDEEDEDYVQQVKKNKKQKDDREEQKRKQQQLQQQQEEEEEQRRQMLKKQKEQQIQQEELRKKQEEEERLQELSKQQKVKRDIDDDQITQKKKQKKQKKQLSLEEFQQSLKLDEEQPQLTSFAQKEAKEKAILEQKTFTLVKETPQQIQEQKVFKLQAIPKKQQQFIQEEESELESESDNDEEFDTPKSINCFESKNKFIQQICQLCQTKVAYQVNQQNWQKIGINEGFRYLLKIEFRQSFEPLIEFTFKSIGEIGSYYLSFKDHTVCLSAENLSKITNVDKVLKHFTGNQLADYNSPVDIPAKSQPINFLLSAEYDSLLNGFSCRRFQIAIKTDLKYKLSKKNDINVKQIIFYKNKLKLKYIGLIQINGVVHQASFDQEEGGEATNLIVTQLNLPKEQGVIASLVDKYIDNNFVADMLQKSEQMMADLQIQTHIKNDDIGLTFNLRKRKGK
ncbi:unnamed protein product [Paramecium pentaurelia]|uniref:Transmembrane protein n=1 Tax=Paramecium pentaurelia TaxID=43138 RepID=A0A8S1VAE4_9CILI|nr:unnamed protein product [Paramecium pentaurelia]